VGFSPDLLGMKYSDILILTKDELASLLITKDVPVDGKETIQQLRAMAKAVLSTATMELDNITEKSDDEVDDVAESVPGPDGRNSDEVAEKPRLPSPLYDRETVGTGRPTGTPEEKANKLREIFEIVRRNLERASRDQAS